MISRRHAAFTSIVAVVGVVGALLAGAATGLVAQANAPLAPLRYTIRFPEPASKTFDVEIVVPTDQRESVELMMSARGFVMGDQSGVGAVGRITMFSSESARSCRLIRGGVPR